jgi:hypothetical protein
MVNPLVTTGQVLVKILGGLLWYWIFFVKLKIQNKLFPKQQVHFFGDRRRKYPMRLPEGTKIIKKGDKL